MYSEYNADTMIRPPVKAEELRGRKPARSVVFIRSLQDSFVRRNQQFIACFNLEGRGGV